jgi:TolB-like protein
MIIRFCAAILTALWLGGRAISAATGVSVLYFDNLSAEDKSPHLGKAITEILISDLSGIAGFTLVERQQLEKVMQEMALGQSGMVDEKSSAKVGALLGAQYLVAGTYLATRRDIVITYKLLGVETGTIIVADKVAGKAGDIVNLTNRLAEAVVEGLATRIPAIHPTPRTVDTQSIDIEKIVDFGKALDLGDKGEFKEAQTMLKSVLFDAPSFEYARRELTALGKRIAEYDRQHDAVIDKMQESPLTYQSFLQVSTGYLSGMQYSKLLAYCLKLRPNPPQAPEGSMTRGDEMLDYYIITAANALKRYDVVVAEGEAFLKKNPSSMYYGSVKMMLQGAAQTIGSLKTQESAMAQQLQSQIVACAKATNAEKSLCSYDIAMTYLGEGLYRQALGYFKNVDDNIITAQRMMPGDLVLYSLFTCYYNVFDKEGASRVFAAVQKRFPESSMLQSMQTMLNMFAE